MVSDKSSRATRWDLIWPLIKRNLASRYQGSYLGFLWAFITPLFMLAIYTFVFGTIFKARWRADVDNNTEFALILFGGLILYTIFAESINQSPSLILQNSNLVKKVVFPLETLTIVSVFSSLVQGCFSFTIWLLAFVVLNGLPHLTILYVPVILIPLVLLSLGVSWIFSSLGVYLRDLITFITLLTTALLFMSPVFYPITALPENYRFLMLLNPLTITIEEFRATAYFGEQLNWYKWGLTLMINGSIAAFGYWWFMKTKKGFADVL